MVDSSAEVKRYAPPPQRNRSLNRRKSGERFERVNYPHLNDGEKSDVVASTVSAIIDHGETVRSNSQNGRQQPSVIPIDGCCRSEAAQLMNSRWAAAFNAYNDPSVDLSERPVVYSGASGSAWGHSKLPHQFDFLAELRRAIRGANTTSNAPPYN